MMRELPRYTATASQRRLPAAVAEAAVQLADAVARVAGDKYHRRPGLALEWITENSDTITDREIRDLSVACDQWIDHPVFVRQFSAALAAAAKDLTGTAAVPLLQQGVSDDPGVTGTPVERADHIPEPVTRDTVIDTIARTIARSYGCSVPTPADFAAARDVVDHFSALVRALMVDTRIAHAASPASAIDNLARLIGPHAHASALLRGNTTDHAH